MTTVAYRDGVMASDSQATSTKVQLLSEQKKVFRLKCGDIIGCAGATAAFPIVVRELNKAAKEGEGKLPSLPRAATVMLATKEGKLWMWEKGWEDYTAEPYMAIGTGWVVALAAMDAGADAKKAVEIACRRDVYTSGRIQVVRV